MPCSSVSPYAASSAPSAGFAKAVATSKQPAKFGQDFSVAKQPAGEASQSSARMLVLFEVTQVTVLMCKLDVELGLYKYSE